MFSKEWVDGFRIGEKCPPPPPWGACTEIIGATEHNWKLLCMSGGAHFYVFVQGWGLQTHFFCVSFLWFSIFWSNWRVFFLLYYYYYYLVFFSPGAAKGFCKHFESLCCNCIICVCLHVFFCVVFLPGVHIVPLLFMSGPTFFET